MCRWDPAISEARERAVIRLGKEAAGVVADARGVVWAESAWVMSLCLMVRVRPGGELALAFGLPFC